MVVFRKEKGSPMSITPVEEWYRPENWVFSSNKLGPFFLPRAPASPDESVVLLVCRTTGPQYGHLVKFDPPYLIYTTTNYTERRYMTIMHHSSVTGKLPKIECGATTDGIPVIDASPLATNRPGIPVIDEGKPVYYDDAYQQQVQPRHHHHHPQQQHASATKENQTHNSENWVLSPNKLGPFYLPTPPDSSDESVVFVCEVKDPQYGHLIKFDPPYLIYTMTNYTEQHYMTILHHPSFTGRIPKIVCGRRPGIPDVIDEGHCDDTLQQPKQHYHNQHASAAHQQTQRQQQFSWSSILATAILILIGWGFYMRELVSWSNNQRNNKKFNNKPKWKKKKKGGVSPSRKKHSSSSSSPSRYSNNKNQFKLQKTNTSPLFEEILTDSSSDDNDSDDDNNGYGQKKRSRCIKESAPVDNNSANHPKEKEASRFANKSKEVCKSKARVDRKHKSNKALEEEAEKETKTNGVERRAAKQERLANKINRLVAKEDTKRLLKGKKEEAASVCGDEEVKRRSKEKASLLVGEEDEGAKSKVEAYECIGAKEEETSRLQAEGETTRITAAAEEVKDISLEAKEDQALTIVAEQAVKSKAEAERTVAKEEASASEASKSVCVAEEDTIGSLKNKEHLPVKEEAAKLKAEAGRADDNKEETKETTSRAELKNTCATEEDTGRLKSELGEHVAFKEEFTHIAFEAGEGEVDGAIKDEVEEGRVAEESKAAVNFYAGVTNDDEEAKKLEATTKEGIQIGAVSNNDVIKEPVFFGSIVLVVDGMMCGGCAKAVASTLEKNDDVASVSVDLEHSTASITCSGPRLDLFRIVEALRDIGMIGAYIVPDVPTAKGSTGVTAKQHINNDKVLASSTNAANNSKDNGPTTDRPTKSLSSDSSSGISKPPPGFTSFVQEKNSKSSNNNGGSSKDIIHGTGERKKETALSLMDELRVGTMPLRRYRCACGCDTCICSCRPLHDGDEGRDVSLSDICKRLEEMNNGLVAVIGEMPNNMSTSASMLEAQIRHGGGSVELRDQLSKLPLPCGCSTATDQN